MRDGGYTPIEAYGVVGNLETAALVAPDGSVDWFPFPHVESPSIFGAVLDAERGGRFRVGPADSGTGTLGYLDGTNVLQTRFETGGGALTVTDFMPPADLVDHPKKVLYRRLDCEEGAVDVELAFDPAFDYARTETTLEATDTGLRAAGREERTTLEAEFDLDIDRDAGRATGATTLEAGRTEWVLLRCTGAEDAATDPAAALSDTVDYWRDWSHDCPTDEHCVFGGPWHDHVVRSGLVLKLLTHAESGAIAAAPTTSLPEDVGGVRNWDYRYNWLRDAGFTVQALSNLGHVGAAAAYVSWFLDLCGATEPATIQPLYGLHGETALDERELDHLSGYRGSRPVRVGNGAADQRQLDIYGELLLAVDELHTHDRSLSADEWTVVRDIVDYVTEVWQEPDAGIWEVRDGPKQFVYSKVLCWVALDRGLALASDHGYDAPVDAWRETRNEIRESVLQKGYDDELGAFVQTYGDGTTLDATGLLLPVVGFLPFDDERVQGTIDAVETRLREDEVLVRRYDGSDGLPGEEGAFVLCACWLIDALALSGRVETAHDRLETLVEYVNPLGLLAEEIDPDDGTYLGNYPQAFSHIGLVNSALYVGAAQGGELPGPPPMGIRLGDPIGMDDY
ncbi:glycoside hydrolase family 15 protein [Haloarcula sp. S1CR25-12]|uniref:Glycoside hydrolase family 15 protein n=1 Tax=Haloarcula saliterrae TaxID=2950534 RepID=A0ABU2FC21_9EURY|nr:glycoside hydrolase family 15 protein [Haloarcula sp. S1CR25-12]MDS0259732.1 glycoside hydrolase family 15 protein [Haloarcula sp. S1CR25-12]